MFKYFSYVYLTNRAIICNVVLYLKWEDVHFKWQLELLWLAVVEHLKAQTKGLVLLLKVALGIKYVPLPQMHTSNFDIPIMSLYLNSGNRFIKLKHLLGNGERIQQNKL